MMQSRNKKRRNSNTVKCSSVETIEEPFSKKKKAAAVINENITL